MPDFSEIRRTLHSNPGISGNEQYAHDLIVQELGNLSPTELYDHVGGYGVVAYWKSAVESNKTLAFRADIDALPSGHRCGHDGHTAIMLRFAEIVAKNKNMPYNILLVFQPEEETGKGAKKIVASGLMQKHQVKAVFGMHNIPGYPKGSVLLNQNTFAAASCGVMYMLHGRQTHASTPEKGLNPGLAVAEIISKFSKLNKSSWKELKDFRQTTLICCRVGEEAFGTSAGDGEVMFTLRTLTNDGMLDLMSLADKITIDAAQRYGLELQKRVREPFRATENNPELVGQLASFMGSEFSVVNLTKPFRWSEDFAEYLRFFPGAFFGVGSGEKQPELHHPSFIFPDEIIEPAAHCFELIMNNIKI